MTIDVDGAPNAYGPNDSGLDFNQNAQNNKTGKWSPNVLLLDANGNPVLQKTGPYQGYYIAATSLQAKGDKSNPGSYVDATQIPYIVLTGSVAKALGIILGDLAVVSNQANDRYAYAIYADNGDNVGEGSVKLADALGVKSDPRHGGVASGIRYLVFPRSGLGQGKLRTLNDINTTAGELFRDWGGPERMIACSGQSRDPRTNTCGACKRVAEGCWQRVRTSWSLGKPFYTLSLEGECMQQEKACNAHCK